MPETLTQSQAMRYNRHVVLPQIDLQGQEKLLNGSVLLIGVGGLGTHAAQNLCASGVGRLTLVDDDVVEAHNLPRQILFTPHQCNKNKALAATESLLRLNPDCKIAPVTQRLGPESLLKLTKSHDVILDCTDNIESRRMINHAAWRTSTPLVSGAAIRLEGQLFVINPMQNSSCYACMERLFKAPDLSCTEAGIFAPVVSTIGIAQAMLAMQILMGFSDVPTGELQLFDAQGFQWQRFHVPKYSSCPVCVTPKRTL